MAKLTGKELESIFAKEYTTRVGTGETTIKKAGDETKEVAVRKLFRIHPNNFHPAVVEYMIQEGLSRMHGRFLNQVAVEKGMKLAAWEAMLEELNAGKFPKAMEAKRQGSAALSTLDSVTVDLAKKDLIAVVGSKVKGTGKGGRVLVADILTALNESKTMCDLVRAAGDGGLAWDDKQVLEWATDESRKRDYVKDAQEELDRMKALEETAGEIDIDDLTDDL